MPIKRQKADKTTLYCSFCGKSEHEVRKLIAGPTVFICDECIELCQGIVYRGDENKPEKIEGDPDGKIRYIVHIEMEKEFTPREQNFSPPLSMQ